MTTTSAIVAVRRLLLVILLLGTGGTFVELLLLEHHEDAAQLVPLALLVAGAAAAAWHARRQTAGTARLVRGVMVAFVCAGVAGVYFHYRANVEFQLEMDPTLGGRALMTKVLQAQAPPALSPGVMIQLGLIGIAFTYRYNEGGRE